MMTSHSGMNFLKFQTRPKLHERTQSVFTRISFPKNNNLPRNVFQAERRWWCETTEAVMPKLWLMFDNVDHLLLPGRATKPLPRPFWCVQGGGGASWRREEVWKRNPKKNEVSRWRNALECADIIESNSFRGLFCSMQYLFGCNPPITRNSSEILTRKQEVERLNILYQQTIWILQPRSRSISHWYNWEECKKNNHSSWSSGFAFAPSAAHVLNSVTICSIVLSRETTTMQRKSRLMATRGQDQTRKTNRFHRILVRKIFFFSVFKTKTE